MLKLPRKFEKKRKTIEVAAVCSLVVIFGAIVWLFRTIMTNQERASQHATEAAIHEAKRANIDPHRGLNEENEAAHEADLADFHAKMNQKWEYAASHPWVSVEPDPPEPK